MFTSFDGIPRETQGGPGNIIFKILKTINREKYSCDFLSYGNYLINPLLKTSTEIKPGLKKTVTDYLYCKSRVYRMLTANSFYLKRHFESRDRYFAKYSGNEIYEIVHSHDTLSGYYFRPDKKAVKILTIHGNGSIESDWADAASKNKYIKEFIPEFKKREIEAYNSADVVTFPGTYAKELFLSDYGIKLRRDKDLRVIQNGIDTEFISEVKPEKSLLEKYGLKPSHDIVLLNPAAHVRQKNIDLVIATVEKLVSMKRNPLLINAGSGPLTGDLNSLIKNKNLGRNVVLAGKISHSELISLMKSSGAVIMMSERIIFDLVILEAAACGIPLVTDLSGGNREMLEGYEMLAEIKDKSPEATAGLIMDKIYSGTLRKRKNPSFRFKTKMMTDAYEKLYNEVIR
ncbi:MAG: glycosyltransferase family 4 protein [Bacteroidetes bacterium]|nr:glycosyltransferase family 4 protein [Bacteroidota bacterium]